MNRECAAGGEGHHLADDPVLHAEEGTTTGAVIGEATAARGIEGAMTVAAVATIEGAATIATTAEASPRRDGRMSSEKKRNEMRLKRSARRRRRRLTRRAWQLSSRT